MRAFLVVHQPCVICEGDLEIWTYYRDDESGAESLEKERLDHDCPEMRRMLAERRRLSPCGPDSLPL